MSQRGRWLWCVIVTKDVASDGRIFVSADDVRTTADGAVAFVRVPHGDRPERVELLIPAGKWRAVYAASIVDGRAVAVIKPNGKPYKLPA